MKININGNWYSVGDTVTLGSFFKKNWVIESINTKCSAILVREGSRKQVLGIVKWEENLSPVNPEAFNRWIYNIHQLATK